MHDEHAENAELPQDPEDLVTLTPEMFEEEDQDEVQTVIEPAPFLTESAFDGNDEGAAAEESETVADQGAEAADEAVGISYNEGANPVISAIGEDERAAAIIAMAKEEGIYIHKDKVLLGELKKLREGEEIPKELFGIIATILSFSYLLQGKTPESWTRPDGTVSVNTTI